MPQVLKTQTHPKRISNALSYKYKYKYKYKYYTRGHGMRCKSVPNEANVVLEPLHSLWSRGVLLQLERAQDDSKMTQTCTKGLKNAATRSPLETAQMCVKRVINGHQNAF